MGSEYSERDIEILNMEKNLENAGKDGGGNLVFLMLVDRVVRGAQFVLLIVKG